MPTYKDLGNGNFQKTTESSEQLNVDALTAELATIQTRVDAIITDIQAASEAGTDGASDALATLISQPLSPKLAGVQSLSARLAS